MKIKDGFVLREVCGERIIVGEGLAQVDFGRIIALNETAAFIWRKAVENGGVMDAEALADSVTEEYEVEREVALRDVEALIREWSDAGLCDPC